MSAAAAPDRPAAVAVEMVGLSKSFAAEGQPVRALVGLDARIRRGGITGLVGPDGAGKTTLLRLVAGLLIPDAGTLRVLGLDAVARAEALRGRVGYMPQRFGLYEDLSVDENLRLYADLHGLPPEARSGRFRELMGFTGLAAFGRRLAGQLSGGMKQKLGLACTLVHPPELLLLDEPSVGVDPVSRRELWRIVSELARDGMTVVWSTAYHDEAERCEDVLVLHAGHLLAQSPPSAFLTPLRQRTFALRVAPGERRRAAQRARALPGVLDAAIRGRSVRILLAEGAVAPAARALVPGTPEGETQLEPVAAHLEDAIIALLHERGAVASSPAPPALARDSVAPPHGGEDARAPVIRIHELSRTFGSFTAVARVSFEVSRGEIFGLLGPNGAGKSTTFRMLCGLLPPSSGEARVLGIDLRRSAPQARARIGYMSQKFSLYGLLSVEQNLRFFGSAYGLAGDRRRRRIETVLDDFGLRSFAGRSGEELPLGYRQRLSLGCALLHEPEILFLDEPTSGVDPLTRREFWSRINALAESGVTVMVTTHFLDEAEYCDRLGIMYRGRLVGLGSPDELKAPQRTEERPEPTLEDAFVALIEAHDHERPA